MGQKFIFDCIQCYMCHAHLLSIAVSTRYKPSAFWTRLNGILLLLNSYAITSDPLSLLSLSTISALPKAMIFSCLMLRQPWDTLGPLLLLFCHSGITSLLLFVRLFYLLPFPRPFLALSLTFFLELKCTESAYLWLTPSEALYKYLNIIQYNRLQCRLFFCSAAVCDDLWKRDDDLPADVLVHGTLSRDAQQRQGIHEATPCSEVTERKGY